MADGRSAAGSRHPDVGGVAHRLVTDCRGSEIHLVVKLPQVHVSEFQLISGRVEMGPKFGFVSGPSGAPWGAPLVGFSVGTRS